MKTRVLIFMLLFSASLFSFGCNKENVGDEICTLEIECLSVFDNMDDLNPEKRDIIPKDGYIFKSDTVYFSEGESAMDVFIRELMNKKIPYDKKDNYVRGINNLYEGDCGEMSGWVYTVNGESPTVDMSSYKLKEGDKILIQFICSWE